MKLKDGFYASSHGIGGLMLDMPTKNLKTRKKPKVKVGDMVRCEAEGFIYPFRGYVEHLYNHSAIIRIEKYDGMRQVVSEKQREFGCSEIGGYGDYKNRIISYIRRNQYE